MNANHVTERGFDGFSSSAFKKSTNICIFFRYPLPVRLNSQFSHYFGDGAGNDDNVFFFIFSHTR